MVKKLVCQFTALGLALCVSTAAQAVPFFPKIKGRGKISPAYIWGLQHALSTQTDPLKRAQTLAQLEAAKQAAEQTIRTPITRSPARVIRERAITQPETGTTHKAAYPKYQRRMTPVERAQKRLDDIEKFIEAKGYFPRSQREYPDEAPLAINMRNACKQLGPDHPICQKVRQLLEQYYVGKNDPLKNLEETEKFIAEHGFTPHYQKPYDYVPLYEAASYSITLSGPADPTAQQIQRLRAFYHIRSRKSPQNWLKELGNFVAQNNYYPALGNTLEENLLYFELDCLIKKLDVQDPVFLRINEYRLQYAQERFSPPPDYNYVPQNKDLAYVQEYVKTHAEWPALSSTQDPQAARHLLAAVRKDVMGRLSLADREQLYSLFVSVHPDGNIIPSLVRMYEKNAARYEKVPPALPKAEYLSEDAANPYAAIWQQPQQFPQQAADWDFLVRVHFAQQIYPNRLSNPLMRIDLMGPLYNFPTKPGETK